MEAFLAFVEQMPLWQRLAWAMACLGAGWLLEGFRPLVPLRYRKARHAALNSVFLLLAFAVNAGFGLATVLVAGWTASHEFGLLHLVRLPLWAELVLALLLLDVTAQYFAHWLLHRVKWMWRFHVVHHSDASVDATTGVRLHPGDIAARETLALAAMAVAGVPLAFYLLYRLVTLFFTFLTHANIDPPRRLDAALSLVFVTPNMHKFHHHFERPWTDSNFGGILSIWDRMFGTFVYGDPRTVQYGVDVADQSRDEDLRYQLLLPFDRKERLERNTAPDRGAG